MYFLNIPKNINIIIGEDWIKIEGPLGTKIKKKSKNIKLYKKNNKLYCLNTPSNKISLFLHQLTKLFLGLLKGYSRKLQLIGVGYKVFIENNFLIFRLGFSHPIYYKIPKNIKVQIQKLKPSNFVIFGNDSQQVNQVAAEIRSLKKPEIYKGKGIRYVGENIKLKEGKKSNL